MRPHGKLEEPPTSYLFHKTKCALVITILEWTTGLTFFWFYTFLMVGLLYIWVICDNISALSGECDTSILKVAVISQMGSIKCILFTA